MNQKEKYESKMIILQEACKERNFILHSIDLSEFEKFDGAMTCKSLFINL